MNTHLVLCTAKIYTINSYSNTIVQKPGLNGIYFTLIWGHIYKKGTY